MPKILSPGQVEHYRRDGFACPVPVLDAGEVRELRADLEYWEKQQGHPLDYPEKSKSYLLYRWADTLVHHPKVLDAVEDLIGPDILVYHSTMWIKEAHTPAYVRWHQDGAYFFLDPLEHVTAWVALSEASELAGCMRVIPGTHRLPLVEHDDKPGPHNMINRGQGISERFDGDKGVSMPLRTGELSLHHTALVHCSPVRSGIDTPASPSKRSLMPWPRLIMLCGPGLSSCSTSGRRCVPATTRMQPARSDASESATQAVTCSSGSRKK